MKKSNTRAFSLIELLVALSILAVVSALIIPRFLNVRVNAAITASVAQIKELQATYQKFISLGGSGSASSGDVVLFLSAPASAAGTARTAIGTMKDNTDTFGSTTISFSGATITAGTTPTAASAQGFYSSATATAGSGTGYYVDGAGDLWTLTTTTSGTLTAAHTTVATGGTSTAVN